MSIVKSFHHVLIICYSHRNFQSDIMKLQWLKLESFYFQSHILVQWCDSQRQKPSKADPVGLCRDLRCEKSRWKMEEEKEKQYVRKSKTLIVRCGFPSCTAEPMTEQSLRRHLLNQHGKGVAQKGQNCWSKYKLRMFGQRFNLSRFTRFLGGPTRPKSFGGGTVINF